MPEPDLIWETDVGAANIRSLEKQPYDFNVQATGIADGELYGSFTFVKPLG
jgi:hypothetical protein